MDVELFSISSLYVMRRGAGTGGYISLCVARSDFSEIARILTFSLNLVRIRSDFTFLSKKMQKFISLLLVCLPINMGFSIKFLSFLIFEIFREDFK